MRRKERAVQTNQTKIASTLETIYFPYSNKIRDLSVSSRQFNPNDSKRSNYWTKKPDAIFPIWVTCEMLSNSNLMSLLNLIRPWRRQGRSFRPWRLKFLIIRGKHSAIFVSLTLSVATVVSCCFTWRPDVTRLACQTAGEHANQEKCTAKRRSWSDLFNIGQVTSSIYYDESLVVEALWNFPQCWHSSDLDVKQKEERIFKKVLIVSLRS